MIIIYMTIFVKQFLERGFLFDDRNSRFQVGWRDVGDQSRFETVAQPFFQPGDIARHFVRSEDNLMALRM